MESVHTPCHLPQGSCAIAGHMLSFCCFSLANSQAHTQLSLQLSMLSLPHPHQYLQVHALCSGFEDICTQLEQVEVKQKLILPSFQGQAESTNKGRVLGYRCPLPQVLRTASHRGVWVLLVPSVHRQQRLWEISRIWQRRTRGQTCFFFF